MPEHSPEPFLRGDLMTFTVGDQTISDSPERIAACYNAMKSFDDEFVGLMASGGEDAKRTLRSHIHRYAMHVLEFDGVCRKEWSAHIWKCVDACKGLNPEHVGELVACLEELLAEAKDCFFHLDHCKGDCRSVEQLDAGKGGGWPEPIKKARELLARVKA